jgi:hypothetical protein
MSGKTKPDLQDPYVRGGTGESVDRGSGELWFEPARGKVRSFGIES